MTFRLIGTPTGVTRSFVRAWLHASLCVMAFHHKPLTRPLVVQFRSEMGDTELGGTRIGNHLLRCDGYVVLDSLITLRRDLGPEQMATAIVHEVIHACFGNFGAGTNEKCCSTLTARLKPTVRMIAEELLFNMQKRAAYVAHTKIAYRTSSGDRYDDAQHEKLGVKDRPRRPASDALAEAGCTMCIHGGAVAEALFQRDASIVSSSEACSTCAKGAEVAEAIKKSTPA